MSECGLPQLVQGERAAGDSGGVGAQDAPSGYDVIIHIVAGADLPSFTGFKPNSRMVPVGAMAGQPPADFGMEMVAAFKKSMSLATLSDDTVPAPARGPRPPNCSLPRIAAS